MQSLLNLLLLSFPLLLSKYTLVSGKVLEIVPTRISPCSADSCLTLSQFAENSTHHIDSNTKLFITEGTHSLDITSSVSNVINFFMLGANNTNHNYVPTITCNKSINFNFTNIGSLHINGLTFKSCDDNTFESVSQLSIESSRFLDSKSPLTIIDSNASISGTYFYSNSGSHKTYSRLLQRFSENQDKSFKASLGGALIVTHSTITIQNCHFNENTATFGGAIFSEFSSNIIINNSNFIDNHAKSDTIENCAGGALLIDDKSMVVIHNCIFRDNTANSDGGIVAVFNSILLVSQSNISNNTASRNGGAVTASLDSSIALNFSYVNDNQAKVSGGAVYLFESNATLDSCTILSNKAWGDGGVIYETHGSTVKVNNSILSSNKAQGNGGAVYGQNNSHVVFNNCNVDSNTAKSGGVIQVNMNSALFLYCSNFTDNNGSAEGGVAHAQYESMINIKQCNLIDNYVDDSGGAVYAGEGSNVKISDSNIADNKADYGGALEVEHLSNSSIAFCNFSRNFAKISGGAIHVYISSAASIKSSNFNRNWAHSSGATVYGRRNCNISISDSSVHNGMAEFSGGGVYLGHDSNIYIQDCTFVNNTADFGAAVRAYVRATVTITNSIFNQSKAAIEGGALHAYRNSFITVQSSNFTSNEARSGGICLALLNCQLIFQESVVFNNSAYFGGVIGLLERSAGTVIGGVFTHNTAHSGGVLHVQRSKVIVKMSTTFNLNSATLFGGVIHASDNCSVVISMGTFTNNTADDGGVLSLLDGSIGLVEHSDFISNQARDSGGVIYLNKAKLCVSSSRFNFSFANRLGGIISASAVSEVLIARSNFSHNTAKIGAALGVVENSTLSFTSNQDLVLLVVNNFKVSTTGDNEIVVHKNTALQHGGGIYLSESSLCIGIETNISFNKAKSLGGGIHAINSSITIKNVIHFISNEAKSGGGLSLRNSLLYDVIGVVSDMNFVLNRADYGGALHVKLTDNDENYADMTLCSGEYSSASGCFFQNVSNTFMMNFNGNYAYQGQNLFGGLLDRCTATVVNSTDHSQNLMEPNGIARFKSISNITSIDTISSKPVRVCLCANHKPNCDIQSKPVQVESRGTILLELAAVDQVNSKVSATIKSNVKDYNLTENEATQTIGAACSNLSYHITAIPREDPYEATISAEGPCGEIGISKLTVPIKVVNCTCAPGFMEGDDNKACECTCDRKLLQYNYIKECNSKTDSVIRNGVFWITITKQSAGNYSYLFFPYCPMDYCQSPNKSIHVNLSQDSGSDALCINNRGGLLCGKCKPHHSLSISSSKCVQCHKEWHGLLVGITITAIFAGILLVAILLVLNLTVAVGTLNSIIFYANIIYSSRILRQSHFMSVFISWLNLDIGFDVCFYEGMDAYTKTWLQLAFPAYIIFLVVAIIWISSHSSPFSNLIGKRNPVATLATLILIFYTKLLQTIIITFSFVRSNGSITPATRWLYDASIVYFGWKHAILFCVAVLILILGLLYTILIFSWQWLLHCPRSKVFNWTRNQKLQSFIDTYHIPHTAKHRYWTGLLLLVRIILNLIAAFSASVYADPHIPILSTIIVICCLFLFKTVMMIKVYKNWLLNAMDSLICFNIIIPAIFTLHSFTDKSLQTTVIDISVGVTVTLLWFIIAFHIYRYSSVKLYTYCQSTRLYKSMIRRFSFTQFQEKTTSNPSDGRLLDVLDSLRQDDDPICDHHDEPTSSVVSLVHSDESPSTDYSVQLNDQVSSTKKNELSSHIPQEKSIGKLKI